MTDLDLTKAVEAAAQAINPDAFDDDNNLIGRAVFRQPLPETRKWLQEDAKTYARTAITAALPELEKQIRKQIAGEIRAEQARLTAQAVGKSRWQALEHAARIAEGK